MTDEKFEQFTNDMVGALAEQMRINQKDARPIPDRMILAKRVFDKFKVAFPNPDKVYFEPHKALLGGSFIAEFKKELDEREEIELRGEQKEALAEVLKNATTFSISLIDGGIQVDYTMNHLYELPEET